MAQIEQSDGGKKKKGAQKKMSIHVDFTPMVDMNMLLITFFMLCTTMIKSQTLQIILPTNEDVKKEQQAQAKQSEAITLILDTEYEGDKPKVDAETGKTVHNIYYYEGIADTTFSSPRYLRKEAFIGNQNHEPQGIRKILRGKNKPCFSPNVDCGDNVIIINADKVVLTGKKWTDREYLRFTGYPGGQRVNSPLDLQKKSFNKHLKAGYNPLFIKVVKGMLPKHRLGRAIIENMHVYNGSEHPHQAQNPRVLDINTIK